jgi:DNA/RNA-binding domain of Phe-tRNA-synthetase-like protein
MIVCRWSLSHPTLIVALVTARGVQVAPSPPALQAEVAAAVTAAQSAPAWPPPAVQAAIRDMLRPFGYKPTGRGKPASEYLAEAARRDAFPMINNVVDINNEASLRTGWPISMLDAARALGDAPALEVRVGGPDERYVFNQAGHELSLKGLIGVGRVGGPLLGNPVKDAMAAKVIPDTRDLIVILYASTHTTTPAALLAEARALGARLQRDAGADHVEAQALP